ncbi:MAG: hypothetical protein AAF438_10160 [Pseudomonadota bacterium]
MASKKKKKKSKRRNPVAGAAILSKGGVHKTSKSGQRSKQKKELKRAIDED